MTKKSDRALNPQQEAFVREYLIDHNGAAAARRAGYATKNAANKASKLLDDGRIIAAVQSGEARLATRYGVTKERITQELARIAFSNIQDYAGILEEGKSLRDIPADQTAALKDVDINTTVSDKLTTKRAKISLADKRQALMDLAKIIGMTTDHVEVTGKLSLADLVEKSMEEPKEEAVV